MPKPKPEALEGEALKGEAYILGFESLSRRMFAPAACLPLAGEVLRLTQHRPARQRVEMLAEWIHPLLRPKRRSFPR